MDNIILLKIAEAQKEAAKMNQDVERTIANTEKACVQIRKISVDTTGIRRAVAQGEVTRQGMGRITRSVRGKVVCT